MADCPKNYVALKINNFYRAVGNTRTKNHLAPMTRLPDEHFFQSLVYRILTRTAGQPIRRLASPLVVRSLNGFNSIKSDRELERWLRSYQSCLEAAGTEQISSEILDHQRSSKKMAVYLVKHTYFDQQGAQVGFDTVRYFVRSTDDQPMVEMIERL